MNELKARLIKAANELKAAGWIQQFSVMHAEQGLNYGTLFVNKDGVKFYLNKDTCMQNCTGPEMAKACKPLFN